MADNNMAAKTVRWTDSATSLLLEYLRTRESLWNTKAESYRNRNKKKTDYEEVLELMRADVPGIDLAILKGKLKVKFKIYNYCNLLH